MGASSTSVVSAFRAIEADMRIVTTLGAAGFIPVIACIGVDADGRLFSVNADTFAGRLAARLGARSWSSPARRLACSTVQARLSLARRAGHV